MSAVHHWEWRTFGSDFGEAEHRIREYPFELLKSFDTHIVCERSDVITKIVDQRLEILALHDVDRHGLEQWSPVLTATFPLTPASVARAFGEWGIEPPPLSGTAWAPDAFLALVERQPGLTAVDVMQERRCFVINGCHVELTDLLIDATPQRSIAVEDADGEHAWRTVWALGLARYHNVNSVKALKRYAPLHAHRA